MDKSNFHKNTVSELFNEEPRQWGLRGDPFLWDEMRIKSKKLYYLIILI